MFSDKYPVDIIENKEDVTNAGLIDSLTVVAIETPTDAIENILAEDAQAYTYQFKEATKLRIYKKPGRNRISSQPT